MDTTPPTLPSATPEPRPRRPGVVEQLRRDGRVGEALRLENLFEFARLFSRLCGGPQ